MKTKILLLTLLILLPASALALLPAPLPFAPYRSFISVPDLDLIVPTVIEIPFENAAFNYHDFLVYETTIGKSQPYAIVYPTPRPTVTWQGEKSFAISTDQPETATVTLQTNPAVNATGLMIALEQFGALPSEVEIRAGNDNATAIVVAKKRLDDTTIRFPLTTANTWQITFTHTQPLKIRDINFIEQSQTVGPNLSLRFLAQPDHNYTIYFDPDRPTLQTTGESGNLLSDNEVKLVSPGPVTPNTLYRIADSDSDGVPDITDNCVQVGNSDQVDVNQNRRGDVCDDFDRDGIINFTDNCPDQPNRNQNDEDGDKIGDVCDEEESRLTERLPWLPWAGIIAAALVVIALFVLTARGAISKK